MAWYRNWFDSHYYHLLYGERDGSEAGHLIRNLLHLLMPASDAVFMDLACGKGRHAFDLAAYGYEVYGLDLSKSSIAEASKMASERLHFFEHDMRLPFRASHFDFILNLFTSFGYFDQAEDHIKTLRGVYEDLKPGGVFIQDYLNEAAVRACLKPFEEKEVNGISFKIEKHIQNKQIIKTIHISDAGEEYTFQEKVNLFSKDDFMDLYSQCGLQLQEVYGDYDLNPFDTLTSPRLLLISKKI